MSQPPHRIYLGLGTNLDDRLANLASARAGLPPAVRPLSVSPVYETPPWGYLDQPAFLNQVVEAVTELTPLALLDYVKNLETRLGRAQTFRYGPRLIDVDILFYDDLVLDTPSLVLPHPQLAERAFMLVPLADLAPDLYHPVEGKTIKELLEGVDRTGIKMVVS